MRRALGVVPFLVLTAPAFAEEPGPSDPPALEIERSIGTVAAPNERASEENRWERVRLDLRVNSRLEVDAEDLEVEVTLVGSKQAGDPVPIPGWRFEQTFAGTVLPAGEESQLHVERPLPARRNNLRAEEIAYQVRILGYRLVSPDLDTTTKLLMSSHQADQRAALMSYTPRPDPKSDGDDDPQAAIEEIKRALASPPEAPSPSDALKLLLGIHAAGSLQDPRVIRVLLAVPERLRGRAGWQSALSELSSRIWEASEPDEPRLEVAPAWARTASSAADKGRVAARTDELIRDAVKEAIIRIGDRGVPELVEASVLGPPAVKVLAAALLHALGRTTVRSQLALSDRAAKLRLVEVYGTIGTEEPIAALAELVGGGDTGLRKAALRTLTAIGPPAVRPLVNALGTPDKASRAAIVGVIESIGEKGRSALEAAASQYGVPLKHGSPIPALARQLADKLSEAAASRWATEIARGLELGRQARYEDAFRILDSAYAADPKLYLEHAAPIARVYLRRAQALFASGNYDAAVESLRLGQSVKVLPEASALLIQAELSLARGYLELEELDKGEEALGQVEAASKTHGTALPVELKALRASLLNRRAQLALERGDHGRARTMIDRARALDPNAPELADTHRRVLLSENLAIVIVLGLIIPGIALAMVVSLRRRVEARRMARLQSAIDRGV